MPSRVIRRRRRGLIMTASLAVGAVLYAVLIFLPGQAKLSELRNKLRQQQEFVVASERLRSTIMTTESCISEISNYCNRWQPDHRVTQQLPEVLADVTDAADREGVTVISLTPGSREPLRTIERIPITLTVDGPWDGMLRFLQEVDQLPMLHWIDSLKLSPQPRTADRVSCTFQLVIFAGFSSNSD